MNTSPAVALSLDRSRMVGTHSSSKSVTSKGTSFKSAKKLDGVGSRTDDNRRFLYALAAGWTIAGFLLWLTFWQALVLKGISLGLVLFFNESRVQTNHAHPLYAAA